MLTDYNNEGRMYISDGSYDYDISKDKVWQDAKKEWRHMWQKVHEDNHRSKMRVKSIEYFFYFLLFIFFQLIIYGIRVGMI